MDSIQKTLRQIADPKTAAFTAKIIPNVDPKSILGIKTPELRALAKELLASPKGAALAPAAQKFLDDLPHKYFEENQLHGFVVSGINTPSALRLACCSGIFWTRTLSPNI